MARQRLIVATLIFAASTAATAGSRVPTRTPTNDSSVPVVTRVFSQVVVVGLPAGFKIDFKDASRDSYIMEAVPASESVNNWSQMITLTGAKGAARKGQATPEHLAYAISDRFRTSCPTSFGVQPAGKTKVSGHDAYVVLVSCGTSATPRGTTSESALIVVVRGQDDYYTIQWAERGAPSRTPVFHKPEVWMERMKRLAPIRLCIPLPQERMPYPSCLATLPSK